MISARKFFFLGAVKRLDLKVRWYSETDGYSSDDEEEQFDVKSVHHGNYPSPKTEGSLSKLFGSNREYLFNELVSMHEGSNPLHDLKLKVEQLETQPLIEPLRFGPVEKRQRPIHDYSRRLDSQFYDIPCEELAKNLIGKVIVRSLEDGTILRGRIVETESYLGGEDKASHTYKGRRTVTTEPAFMLPGTVFTSSIYGFYSMLNVSSQGEGASVLIRALEVVQGAAHMRFFREVFSEAWFGRFRRRTELSLRQLCNGPGKLCISLNIGQECNREQLGLSPYIWLEEGPEEISADLLVNCPRVGVEYAGRYWATKRLRFYLLGNTAVSKRDRRHEHSNLAANRLTPQSIYLKLFKPDGK